jgi:hypothetical protein
VARHASVSNFSWPFADQDHVLHPPSAFEAIAGATLRSSGAQAAMQFAAQLAPALDEQGFVDRFVTHAHHRIVWELDAQPASDLLGRPQLYQP